MDVTIKNQPELRVGTVRHIGPYERIPQAFERLGSIMSNAGAAARGRDNCSRSTTTIPRPRRPTCCGRTRRWRFRAAAEVPVGLIERRVPAGRYASTVHVGSYEQLGQGVGRSQAGDCGSRTARERQRQLRVVLERPEERAVECAANGVVCTGGK